MAITEFGRAEEALEMARRADEYWRSNPNGNIADALAYATGDPNVVPGNFDGKGEVRITSATGGEKGSKKARFDLIPPHQLWRLAEHYGIGAEKYSDDNYRKGYDWKLSIAALERHLSLFKQGEDYDEETGSLHIIAVAWHAFTLAEFFDIHPEYDTRLKTVAQRAGKETS